MARREFPAAVKVRAAKRAGGKCEACGTKIATGGFHYDHINPDGLGGEPTLENCAVLCLTCHRVKTNTQDIPRMAKADRQAKRVRLNIRPAGLKIQSAGFARFERQHPATRPIEKLSGLSRRSFRPQETP